MDHIHALKKKTQIGIEQAFRVSALSKRPVLNCKDVIFVSQEQYSLPSLNYHAPLSLQQLRHWAPPVPS